MEALRSTPRAMKRTPDQRLAASQRSIPSQSWLALALLVLAGLPGCASLRGEQPRNAPGCSAISLDDHLLPADPAPCGPADPAPCGPADPAPCGPAAWPLALRRLVPQQFAGADFRPACRCHDRCYEAGGEDRTACDERFRHNLVNACQSSRFPRLCRLVARAMHCSVACLGGWFYRGDQPGT